MHIDVVRNVLCPTSTTGNSENEVAWMTMQGVVSTNSESSMFEMLYEMDSVSTGRIFHEASVRGIPIHLIDDIETLETDLAAVSASSVVKNHIRSYVNAGYTAMIPEHGVTIGNWSGEGWVIQDRTTGAAGYMICGGLHNETAILNGGSTTSIFDGLVNVLFKIFKTIAEACKLLGVTGSIILAGVVKMIAACLIFADIALYSGSLLLIPFIAVYLLIGIIFLYIALAVCIQLLHNMVATSRRWSYHYITPMHRH